MGRLKTSVVQRSTKATRTATTRTTTVVATTMAAIAVLNLSWGALWARNSARLASVWIPNMHQRHRHQRHRHQLATRLKTSVVQRSTKATRTATTRTTTVVATTMAAIAVLKPSRGALWARNTASFASVWIQKANK